MQLEGARHVPQQVPTEGRGELMLKIALIVAVIAALLGAGSGWFVTRNHYETVLADKDLALAQAQARADSHAAFVQTQSQLAIAQIDQTYQEKLNEKDASHARDLAAVRSGALRLRDTHAHCPAQVQPASGAGRSDAAAGVELSVEATEFLLSEARRADGVVDQLTACQAVIQADRKAVDQLFQKDPE
jgi:prophage endopeptidase